MIAKAVQMGQPDSVVPTNKQKLPILNRIQPARKLPCISCKEERDSRLMQEVYFEGKKFVCDSCRKRYLTPQDSRSIPPEPTKFMPGTNEKILVMRERYSNGYSIWHPKDARYTPDVTTPESERMILTLLQIAEERKRKHED